MHDFTHNVFWFNPCKRKNPNAKVLKISDIATFFEKYLEILIFLYNFEENINHKIMNYYFNIEKKVKVLKHLEDGVQHSEAPEGLTDAEYCDTVKSLGNLQMVIVESLIEDKCVGAQITSYGRSVLEKIKKRENKIVRDVLIKHNLNHEKLQLLIKIKQGLTDSHEDLQNLGALKQKRYIKCLHCGMHRSWKITDDGIDILDEIDDSLYDNIQDDLMLNGQDQAPSTGIDEKPKVSIKSESNKSKHHITIKQGRISDVIKVLYIMAKLELFEEDGTNAAIKNVMECFGTALNSDQLISQYSSYVNRSFSGQNKTALNIFYEMEDKFKKDDIFKEMEEAAKGYYKNRESRKQNKG